MKISGSHQLAVPRDRVWQALQDPAVLARTLPGCVQLERVGDDEYRVTVAAGVGSIKGIYTGSVALADQQPPDCYTLRASGQGSPGTVDATARVALTEVDGGTRVEYDADTTIGGVIGGVGQRVLTGVAKKTAGEFFKAVENDVLAVAPAAPRPAPAAPAPGAQPQPAVDAGAPTVFRPPVPAAAAPADTTTLLAAALAGALIALLGVLVGRRLAKG